MRRLSPNIYDHSDHFTVRTLHHQCACHSLMPQEETWLGFGNLNLLRHYSGKYCVMIYEYVYGVFAGVLH